MAIAPLIVGIRTAGAAALGAAAARLRGVANAARTSSFATRQLTREVSTVAGAYRDANGLWRQADGRLVIQRNHVRHVTTAYGRLHNAIQRATHALVAYTIASRFAQAVSDRTARTLAMMAAQFALLAVKGLAVIAVLLPLIGAIGNIVPAIMLVAPAAGTAGLALLGLKLAFNGVGEALQAGLSGDTEEFEKALKKLAPQAASTVRVLVRLRDTWKPLARDFQGRVFEGAAGELASLSRLIKPIADVWLPKLGLRLAALRNGLANGLASFAADGRLEGVWRNLHVALSGLLDAVIPLGRAFGDILEVAAPRFAKLSEGVGSLAKRFSDWIRASRDNGDLQRWLDRAVATLGQLKDIAGNVGQIIGAIFHAASDEGTDMLTQIEESTRRIAEWANSGEGQGVINFFSNILQYLSQIAPVFSLWAGWFESMVWVVKAAWDGISAIFKGAVALWLGYLEALLYGAVKAFGWIPGIGPKLKGALADFQNFKNGVNAALDGIEDETVNITYRSRVIGDTRVSGAQLSGTYSSGIGGRAAGGPVGRGRAVWVGERGPELVSFGQSGMVHNAQASRRMAGGGGSVNLTLAPAAGHGGNPLVGAVIQLFRDRKIVLRDSRGQPVRLAGA